MKKNLIAIAALLGVILLLPITMADVVNIEIDANGTADIDIVVDADDTLAREMIGDLQEDVYGPEQSDPKDEVLEYVKNLTHSHNSNPGDTPTLTSISNSELEQIKDICNDPKIEYFMTIGSAPPQVFIDYVKEELGYDDELHYNLIWTMCQEEYVNQNEEKWSSDNKGLYSSEVAYLIQRAIKWLLGEEEYPYGHESEKRIGINLDRYFASDKDIYYLNMRINELQIRIEALEGTMDEIASDAYCQGKLETMVKYNLRWVKCGDAKYHNHLIDPATGEEIVIGITPINGEPEVTENHEEETVLEAKHEMDVQSITVPESVEANQPGIDFSGIVEGLKIKIPLKDALILIVCVAVLVCSIGYVITEEFL